MLRFALLVVLPMLALCNPPSASASREETLRELEEHVRPCIVDKVNCPPGSWDYESIKRDVHQIRAHSTPAACNCDTSEESCTRACYYAIMLKVYKQSAIDGLTDPVVIENAKKQVQQLLETHYKPCVLEKRNCELAGGLTYEDMRRQIQDMVKMPSLPEECDFETESEAAIRVCYYEMLKRSALAQFPERK